MAEPARKRDSAPGKPATSLVATVRASLLQQIDAGKYKPGARLPSESRLTEEFSVSRTVVREAIASLRADRLVESRQGAGVFVLPPEKVAPLPFANVDPGRVSSVLEILEIRTAVETEAAALAAVRHAPAQVENMIKALNEFKRLSETGGDAVTADFQLHMAIAEAAGNARFPEFLSLIGRDSIPRRTVETAPGSQTASSYMKLLCDQHEAIVKAILNRDPEGARSAMREHLLGSQARYRNLLHRFD